MYTGSSLHVHAATCAATLRMVLGSWYQTCTHTWRKDMYTEHSPYGMPYRTWTWTHGHGHGTCICWPLLVRGICMLGLHGTTRQPACFKVSPYLVMFDLGSSGSCPSCRGWLWASCQPSSSSCFRRTLAQQRLAAAGPSVVPAEPITSAVPPMCGASNAGLATLLCARSPCLCHWLWAESLPHFWLGCT